MTSSLCGCGDLFQADIAPLVSSAIINPYAVIITKSFMINFSPNLPPPPFFLTKCKDL